MSVTRSMIPIYYTAAAIALLFLAAPGFAGADKPYEKIDEHAVNATPEVEGSLPKLAKYLAGPCKSDKEKVRAVYRWITDRIAYDADSFFAGAPGDSRPEAVLRSRKAVCEGYANLFVDLSSRAGVKVVKIPGHAKTPFASPGQNLAGLSHSWNAVQFDNHWWLIDSTWGAGGLNGREYVKRFSEFFFLTPPDLLVLSHFPKEARWQLLATPLTAAQFRRQPTVPRGLLELGVSAEMIGAAVGDKSFKEFVQAFSYPGNATTLIKAPLEKKLQEASEYEFEFRSDDFAGIALIQAGRALQLEKKGNVFQGRFRVEKGRLIVGGKLRPEDRRYANLMQYDVE
jgi:hypothetical protein